MKTIGTIILGAGQIAAHYDEPGSSEYLTHCHVIKDHPQFKCLGVFDIDSHATEKAARKWEVPVLDSTGDLSRLSPELAVICVPDPLHKELLELCLDHSVPYVLCEKPLSLSYRESADFVKRFAEKGQRLFVNYQRRCDEDLCQIKELYRRGSLGAPLGAHVNYSKGLLHNGSHAVDVLRFLFGEVRAAIKLSQVEDFTPEDPSLGVHLIFDKLHAQLNPINETHYSCFEVDLFFEKKRYRWSQSGMRIEEFEPRPDPHFPSFVELESLGGPRSSRQGQALYRVYDELAETFSGKGTSCLEATSIIGGQKLIEAVKASGFYERIEV